MRVLDNITDDPNQKHTIITDELEFILEIKYISVIQCWFIDVTYEDQAIYGTRLALSTQHLDSKQWPFDFFVIDNSGESVDPFLINDFSSERCSLYILESDDLEEIRGYDVKFL